MSDQSSKKKTPRIWHEKHQSVLKGWGESAACYRYMHFKAYEYYKKSNMLYTLPIIVIGTVTGTANFAQQTFPKDSQVYIPLAIGALNLISAIMTTVSQFLKIAELMESHRVSYINYGKLARNIKLEITLPVSERTHHGANMIDICAAEYDRLIEQCPPVPKAIMRLFTDEFPENNRDPRKFKFTRPEIFTVLPFDDFPFKDMTPEERKPSSSLFNRFKFGLGKSQTIKKELDELRDMHIVTNSDIVIDVPCHPASPESMDDGDTSTSS